MKHQGVGKNTSWLIFLEVVAFLYLLFELSFNARLLTAVGDTPSLDQIHGLEIMGRTVSGVGAALLAWRLIGFDKEKVSRSILILAVSFFAIVPIVYVAQSFIVTSFVKAASQEQKRAAYLSALAWRNASDGLLEFSLLSKGENPIRDATFNATFGVFLMNDSEILTELESKLEEIATRTTYASAGGASLWLEYEAAHNQINTNLKAYENASAQLQKAQEKSKKAADEAWDEMQKSVSEKWRKLDTERKKIFKRNDGIASFAKKQLIPMFEEIKACNGYCKAQVQAQYDQKMAQHFGATIPMDWWCNGWNGEGAPPAYNPKDKKSCPGNDRTMVRAVNVILEKKFKNQTGFPIKVTYSEFIQSDILKDRVSAELKMRGINTDALIFPLKKTQFVSVISNGLVEKAHRDFANKTKELLGIEIPPGLDTQLLLERDDIRAALEEKYGLSKELSLGLSRSAFEEQVLLPALKKHVEDIKEKAMSSSFSEQHEDAFRALIVPPIALIFSLFFSIVNAGCLVIAGACLVSPAIEKFKYVIITTMIALTVFVPFILPSPGAHNPMYKKSIEVLYEQSAVTAFGVDWLNRFEPYVMPVGESIRLYILGGITYGYESKDT